MMESVVVADDRHSVQLAETLLEPFKRRCRLRIQQRYELAAQWSFQESILDEPPGFPHRTDGEPHVHLRLRAFEPLLHRIGLVAVGEDDHQLPERVHLVRCMTESEEEASVLLRHLAQQVLGDVHSEDVQHHAGPILGSNARTAPMSLPGSTPSPWPTHRGSAVDRWRRRASDRTRSRRPSR